VGQPECTAFQVRIEEQRETVLSDAAIAALMGLRDSEGQMLDFTLPQIVFFGMVSVVMLMVTVIVKRMLNP